MRSLLRQPLTWMVAAEVLVVGALAGVAWHELTAAAPGPARVLLPAPSTSGEAAAPEVPAGALTPPPPEPAIVIPGLNVDPAFWRERLKGLNEAEAQFEGLEWRIIHSAMDTVRRYVDGVVIPAIEQAEKGGRPGP